ncbi:hypothetical protein NQ315_008627 [Exocentrus adspersus]|uniref:Uncharacterized protein n=1 Tax=Exocentrus adspersus TaxID=1586481 RepID=A0AAV8W6M0_9CUCU|nr:hypothetical protein NQ315_008627 [Exocentrus adspersus]
MRNVLIISQHHNLQQMRVFRLGTYHAAQNGSIGAGFTLMIPKTLLDEVRIVANWIKTRNEAEDYANGNPHHKIRKHKIRSQEMDPTGLLNRQNSTARKDRRKDYINS